MNRLPPRSAYALPEVGCVVAMTGDAKQEKAAERLISVTVRLTVPELSAVSHSAVVVTSSGDPVVINAADRAMRKLREAAAKHPELPDGTNLGVKR